MAEKMIPYKERTIRELKEEYAAQKARYDTFAAQGLKLDQTTLDTYESFELAQKLREKGFDVPEGIYKIEEVRAAVEAIVGKGGRHA